MQRNDDGHQHRQSMNPDNMALAATILKNTTYITQAQAAKAAQEKKIKTLLSSRSLPVEGWENTTIEMFINELSLMDTNNFIGNVGVGEREVGVCARVHA